MFDKYSFKIKNRVLLVIFILLALASYKRSFVLSILANEEIDRQKTNLANIDNSEYNLQKLLQSVSILDKTIGESNLKPDRIQQEIFNTISANDHNVIVESIEET